MNCRNIIAMSGFTTQFKLGIKSNKYAGDFSLNIL